MNLQNNLIANLSSTPLEEVLRHHGVAPANQQHADDCIAYHCPLCKGAHKPHFLISRGTKQGGLYATPHWQCTHTNRVGHGALELESAISGISLTGAGYYTVLHAVAEIANGEDSEVTIYDTFPPLNPLHANGITTLCVPQDELTIELMDDFTPEGLQALGCQLKRIYTTTHDKREGTRITKVLPATHEGAPLFRYSFGTNFMHKKASAPNFNPSEALPREFALHQVASYTTRRFYHEGKEVSLRRQAHTLFPIFAFVYTVYDDEGKECTWGHIVQPNWRTDPDSSSPYKTGSEQAEFYFYKGSLSPDKINHPILGDMVTNHVIGGNMLVKEAVDAVKTGETLTTHTEEWEYCTVEKMEIAVSRPIKPEHIRVDNILLCSNALNAVCAYYHLNNFRRHTSPDYKHIFFHTAWQPRTGTNLTPTQWNALCSVGSKPYILLDLCNEGKKRAYAAAKRFAGLYPAFLPEDLVESPPLCKGGVEVTPRDVVGFFSTYQLSPDMAMRYDNSLCLYFLKCCIGEAIAIDPLIFVPKFDKKNKDRLLDYSYKVNPASVWPLMAAEGFCREVKADSVDKVGRYLRMTDNFVEEIDGRSLMKAMVDTLYNFASHKAQPCTQQYEKMVNAILTSKDLVEVKAGRLPAMEVNYSAGYGPELDHFFYNNGALRITPHAIEFLPYSKLDFCVDMAEIMPFEFTMPCSASKPPFRITENPEYITRKQQIEAHRLDVDNYTIRQVQEEEKALTLWSRRHRWLFDFGGKPHTEWWKPLQVMRAFANEEFEAEFALNRKGESFSPEQEATLYGRLANLIYVLGRPLFRYKGAGTNFLPYLTENNVTSEGKSEGGTGKSTFVNLFMACAGKILRIDCRTLKAEKELPTYLADYKHHCHRVVHWEDYAKGLKIGPLFNYVTSGFTWRKLNHDAESVLLSESPGMVVTSNYQATMVDSSESGRLVNGGFSHRFSRDDPKKNTLGRPISDIMHIPSDNAADMDPRLRNQVIFLCALAVQFCMIAKTRVDPPMEDLISRSQTTGLGDSFVQWATEFFDNPCNYNAPIDLNFIFEEYINLCGTSVHKRDMFSPSTFRDKIRDYCGDIDVEMNPPCCYSPKNKTDAKRGYMRVKAWQREVYFDDVRTWGKYRRKEIRTLEQSQSVLFFCRKSEIPESYEQVRQLLANFYAQPDPLPICDGEGNPITLTSTELQEWQAHLDRKQGKPTSAFASATPVSVDVGLPPPQQVKPELPF